MSCNHCETPACMTVCPRNCIRKLRNGVVIIDTKDCDGCGKCVSVCPFDAITIDTTLQKADKCDMCYSRQQRGEQPICVDSCIAGAISIVDLYADPPSDYQPMFKEFSMKTITKPTTRFKYDKQEKIRIWAVERKDTDVPFDL